MKTTIQRITVVVVSMMISAHLFAFTAVTSGLWSNAATWGGVGPGSTVTAQDIIIPTGITVDMDVNVVFNGAVNSFTVNGTLNSTGNHDLYISAGAFAGSGSVSIHNLTLNSALATYSSTATINVMEFSNQGATIPLASSLTVSDSLDLSSGTILLNSGGTLTIGMGGSVRMDNGTLVAGGGSFATPQPYDVWYAGATKTAGIEANSANLRDVHVVLSSNSEDLVIGSSLTVNGTLDMAAGHISMTNSLLVLNGDYIGGAGAQFETNNAEIIVDGGTGGLTRDLDFSAGSTLSELTIDRNTVSVKLASAITVTDSLHLMDGNLRLMTGSTFTAGPGLEIYVMDGVFYPTGGTFDGAMSYNVSYHSPTHPAGVELSGTGLNNLTIDLISGGQVVTLGCNVKVNGAFSMIMGRMDLDVYTFEAAGTYDQASNTAILGGAASILHLHMTTSTNDTIWFDATTHGLDQLIIDLPAASTVTLGSEVTIHGQLVFMSGKIDMARTYANIRPGASVTGYDDTKYVVTSDTGYLSYYITPNTSYTEIPIGTASSYSPVAVQQVGSATAGYVNARVMSGVYSNGLTGTNIAPAANVVNRTWVVNGDVNVTMDMNLRVYWLTGDEMNGFNRASSFITHYTNNAWDYDTAAAATSGPFSTYRLTRADGFTNGGAFAVVDSSVPLNVTETATSDAAGVYPNPANDVVNVSVENPANEVYTYELYDATGRLVSGFASSAGTNQIDMTRFDRGCYMLRVTDQSGKEILLSRVVKS